MRIRFFALAALALSLAACTQDEAGFLPEGAEGTPIVFTATGLNPPLKQPPAPGVPQRMAIGRGAEHNDITVTAWWPYTAARQPCGKGKANKVPRKTLRAATSS